MKESTAVTNHANIVLVMIAKVQPNLNWRCIQLFRQEVKNVSLHVEIRSDIAKNFTSYCSLLKKAGPTSRNIAPWHINIVPYIDCKGFYLNRMTTALSQRKFCCQNEVFDSFVRTIYIYSLVTSAFPLSPVQKPCTWPVLIILRISVQMLAKIQFRIWIKSVLTFSDNE